MMNELERLIPLIETAIDNGASIPGLATMNRAKELVKAVKKLKESRKKPKKIETIVSDSHHDNVIVARASRDANRLNNAHNQTWSELNQRWIMPGEPVYKKGDFVFLSASPGYPRWQSEHEAWWNGLGGFHPTQETLDDYLSGKGGLSFPDKIVDYDKDYIDLSTVELRRC